MLQMAEPSVVHGRFDLRMLGFAYQCWTTSHTADSLTGLRHCEKENVVL
jgi:hypothetical protein